MGFTKTAVDKPVEYVKPAFERYLAEKKWPSFDLHFEEEQERKPSGWFSPSSAPSMTERQLYYYVRAARHGEGTWLREPLGVMGALSVTWGEAMHGWVQNVLLRIGILLPPPPGTCPVCRRPTAAVPTPGHCWEWGTVHPETNTRGEQDGRLMHPVFGLCGYEFKSTNEMGMWKFKDKTQEQCLEAYKVKWPHYYGQNQEYMRIAGLQNFVVHIMGWGFPWTQVEIIVPRDEEYITMTTRKYLSVIAAVEAQEPPEPCCARGSATSQQCPARGICPMGLVES